MILLFCINCNQLGEQRSGIKKKISFTAQRFMKKHELKLTQSAKRKKNLTKQTNKNTQVCFQMKDSVAVASGISTLWERFWQYFVA